ncbi:hypothetical protein CHH55_08725 [Niallia circulans]|uniref:hypothetical protein n=1 Tax=Niallia circulans TaxID=1397 RepID=UPI000BA71151|nr:hypothetical protein [Niallia circulans]PAD25702.1 hypothetical protein CHH62_10355 [Niallia circulans]PAD88359.1 hypothetical protein CHH55_08725 [Niallia circulans]
MFVKFADKAIQNRRNVFPIQHKTIFNTAKYICYLIPFLFSAYIYMTALHANQPILRYIEQNPIITILFVIAMVQPFVGVAISLGNKALTEYSSHVLWSFIILAVSEFLMGNILVCILLTWGIFLIKKQRLSRKTEPVIFSGKIPTLLFGLTTSLSLLSLIITWVFLRISGI